MSDNKAASKIHVLRLRSAVQSSTFPHTEAYTNQPNINIRELLLASL